MDSYFLDKRKVKRVLTKYGLIFLCILPILIAVSYALSGIESTLLRVFILVVVASVLTFVIELGLQAHADRKERKAKQDVVVVQTGKKTKTYVNKPKSDKE